MELELFNDFENKSNNKHKNTLLDNAFKIIAHLENNGCEGYIVGGCVRDMLFNKSPSDYDITTSASPPKVHEVFDGISGYKVHDTGIKHGTVTIISPDRKPFEVTTFRIDGEYSDNRRPDTVTFTKSIIEDLARRDFTINAMAYSRRTGIIDPFGGEADLKKGIIRCVGDPYKRFNEDGLRIMRALRFAGCYNFSIEEGTSNAIMECRHLLKNIAVERIATELNKLIVGQVSSIIAEYIDVFGEFMPELIPARGFDQCSVYHDRDVLTHTLNAVDNALPDTVIRLSLLFHDLGKPSAFKLVDTNPPRGSFKGHAPISTSIARGILRRLKYDNDTTRKVLTLVRYHDTPIRPDEKTVKRFLCAFGFDMYEKLIAVHIADDTAKAPKSSRVKTYEAALETAREIIKRGECYSLKQLSLKGGDVVKLGYKGADIGRVLNRALQAVISGKCKNNKGDLINLINKPINQ